MQKKNKPGRKIKHGMSKTPEHVAWRMMIQRCTNTNNARYENYGGRGISVCERWNSFENFFHDMGYRPTPHHSLDRKNNDGDYTPDNCRWATRSQQQLNKRPFKSDHKLPRGDDHWTRKQRKRAVKIFTSNMSKVDKYGDKNPNSKMTLESAAKMRVCFKINYRLTFYELGSMFGVGRETARKVVRGILW